MFNELVKLKSFTKTAEYFDVTQPTISLTIKRLEKQFHNKLIYQTSNQSAIMLTNAGHVLYLKSEEILAELGKLKYDVEHANDRLLRVAFCGFGGDRYMADIVERFNQQGLINMLDTRHELASTAFKELDHGELDAMVYSWSSPVSNPKYVINNIAKGELVMIVSNSHHFAYRNTISINELKHEKFLIRESGNYTREVLLSLCNNAGFKPEIAFTAKSRQLMIQLVEKGIGIALVIDKLVEDNHHIKVIRLPEEQKRWMYVQIAVRKDLIPNKKQSKGIKILNKFHTDDALN
ncbi:LysR family transcriptional regulator [Lactiplantibacillus plajomi]|uniref:LysR family transcriptional regulator n=1 Tax=Lactiplantibacillus plajomi TaxID=1457217 RepID=UPI0039ED2A24